MRIKMLTLSSTPARTLEPGQIVVVPHDEGQALVDGRYALRCDSWGNPIEPHTEPVDGVDENGEPLGVQPVPVAPVALGEGGPDDGTPPAGDGVDPLAGGPDAGDGAQPPALPAPVIEPVDESAEISAVDTDEPADETGDEPPRPGRNITVRKPRRTT